MVAGIESSLVRAVSVSEVPEGGSHVVHLNGHTVAIFHHEGSFYAVDNRCPHMGFPLDRGSVKDCILTCHWHHARFDLNSGGTFDQWADDVRRFPVEVRDGAIWIDLTPQSDAVAHQKLRLEVGLERDISLVTAKAVLRLMEGGGDPVEPFRIGLEFGLKNRMAGWGQGLTIHGCMMNLVPHLDPDDRPRALYHGLTAVARDSAGHAPRFMVKPLPVGGADFGSLKRWFRQFVEVRDAEGAERCLVTAVENGADDPQMADMLFAAATDHRYLQIGHVLDFTNKALEALDVAGWEWAGPALSSLAMAYANADRMEESISWRSPVDLIEILDRAFREMSEVPPGEPGGVNGALRHKEMVPVLLGDDPQAIANTLLTAIRDGTAAQDLAGIVAYAAALRIARFHTSNEFGDWDRALHTFTFANAVHQGLRRLASRELLRGVFDAAMSVYLDRFLNVPAARIPEPGGADLHPSAILEELPELLNRQQQVNSAGELAARYLHANGDPDRLLVMLGRALLREDRDFHTIQCVEAAFRQFTLLRGSPESVHVLVAASRYLAAHAPTVRAQGQTFQIAQRLHRGEHLYDG